MKKELYYRSEMNQELYIKLNDNSMITPVPISYLVFTIYLSSRYLFIFMNASNLVNAPLNIVNTIEILQSIWSEMLPLPSVFAWSVAPTDPPAAVWVHESFGIFEKSALAL